MAWLQKLASTARSTANTGDASIDLDVAKQASREFFSAAAQKTGDWKRQAAQRLDAAAEKVAQTCGDWTGRDTSADDVKRATKIGAAIGVVAAAGPIAAMAMRQARSNGHSASTDQLCPAHDAAGNVVPGVSTADQSQDWEQDDIAYEQMQHDNLQDHLAHQTQLDDVIDDKVSYNA